MEHTYLRHEGLWIATGEYFDEAGRSLSVKGHHRVRHAGMWEIESFMQLMDDSRQTFENNYRVLPFEPGSDFTLWSSRNPALGSLSGRFFVIGDSILSIYASEDGRFTGSEFLLLLDHDLYLNRGALFQEQRRVSAWAVKLARAGGKEK